MFFKLNSKITPFGGIHLIHKQLLSKKTIQFINNELGSRGYACSYNYSDIVLNGVYKYLVNFFSKVVKGLVPTSRLKKFIFRLITIVAKITKSARRQVVHLVTDNKALIELVNSS